MELVLNQYTRGMPSFKFKTCRLLLGNVRNMGATLFLSYSNFFMISRGLHKGYDRFQTLLSQLEIHGAGVSHEDANKKFLRSLPSSWSQVALIMRTKPGLDTLSFDDLYNNLGVFESDVKGTTASSSNTQNVAFISVDNTSSTNDINDDDMENMDLKWQDNSKALVTIYGEDIDWSGHVEEDTQTYAILAYSSNNSSSDNEVKSCSKACEESYARLRKLYDEQRDKLGDASVEITAYTLALKKVEAQLLCHQQNQLAYEQKTKFMKIDLDDKTDVLAYQKKLLTESLKEKEDLKTKFKNWQNSSKNLRNYMPSGPDVEIDYSKFTYGPKQTSADRSNFKPSEYASCESDSSVETSTSMSEPVENASKVICEPKVWTDALIIKEYESDSDNDSVSNVQEDKEKPSFAFTDSVKHVKTSKKNIKETGTTNHSPKLEKQDRNDDPHRALKDKGIIDNGCSRYMTWNKTHLADYQEFKGSSVAFGGSNGRITGKGKIKADRLDFENVYYVEELKHYNLFSVSQMCDKKNKGNLVRGLPSKIFENDKTCVACQKGKQHKASCKAKTDETTPILKDFIRHAENQFNYKVKTIRSDNGTKFKNNELIELCGSKGTKEEYSNSKTPQQNRVADRKNRTLIEAARTMVLVTKPQNKTPYELLTSKQPIISYLRPFGFYVTILNTIDQLSKFDRKSYSRFLVRYSLNSKAFRVYYLETKRVEENLHVNFLENKPNVVEKGHAWMFDLDYLTNSMSYEPVLVENQANKSAGPKEANNSAGTQANDDQGANSKDIDFHEEHFILSIWSAYSTTIKSSGDKIKKNIDFKTLPLSTAGPSRTFNDGELSYPDDPSMPHLKDIYVSLSKGIFTDLSYDDKGVITDFNNLETTVNVSPTPTTRIHTIHPKTQILGDHMSVVHARSKVDKNSKAHALVYKVVKALYGLHQAPRAWYATLSTFLEKSRYRRGAIDKTLFIKQDKKDIMLVQVYVDDIIFGSTNKSWCDEFKEIMKNRSQISFMGELTFFLRLQVKQKEDVIFISQDKFVAEILKKFDFLNVKTASTPIETQKPLVKDEEVANVTPKSSHLQAVKRIFRYLKGQPKLGLQYPKVSSFDLEAYLDSDYAGGNLDRKSTTRGCQFLGRRLISWQCKKHTIMATSTTEAEYVVTAHCDQPPLTESSSDHDSSQDPRVDLEGTCGSEKEHVNLPHDSLLSGGHTSDKAEGSLYLEALYALCTNLSSRVLALETVKDAQAKEILTLKARIKKLEKRCKPTISHHRAWLRSVSLLSKKKKLSQRMSVSKQGRKNAKSGSTKDDSDKLDAELDEDMEYIDTEKALNKGRQSIVDTARPYVSTARPDVSTARPDDDTARLHVSTARQEFNTLIKLKDDKAKGVAFKDSESTDRPARSIITFKPLPTIDLKDKGKGVLEEPESAKKMTKSDFDAT
nr:putative ribonuclease H-like domain-containing protein [Tanacetum cinerariifolium]